MPEKHFLLIGKDSKRELTLKEKIQFDIFAAALLSLNLLLPIQKVITYIELLLTDIILSNVLLSIYILLFTFLCAFIIMVELIAPLRHIRKVCEFVSSKTGKKCKLLVNYFLKNSDSEFELLKARITNWLFVERKKHGFIMKFLLSIAMPFAIMFDFAVNILIFFITIV